MTCNASAVFQTGRKPDCVAAGLACPEGRCGEAADPIHGQVEYGFVSSARSDVRSGTADKSFGEACRSSPKVFSNRFREISVPMPGNAKGCQAKCDSKANRYDDLWALPQLVVNSSFTNQLADSFSASGVNLEARV